MTQTSLPRTVLITGAAGGIGRAMVYALLELGDRVVAVDRDAAANAALAEDAPSRDGLFLVEADLSAAGGAEAAYAAARRAAGPVDALVNNAGIGGSGFWARLGKPRPVFWELDTEVWDQYMRINADAVFRLSRAAAPDLIASGRGRIVNVTTSLLSMLDKKFAPYGPSKAAAESLTAIMSADFEGTGVTANVLIPGGPTDTGMVVGVAKEKLLPPGVMVPPLLWILSEAAAQTTGRRFLAHRWDVARDPAEAANAASDPVAWIELAQRSGRVGNANELIYHDPGRGR
jgi:NAD(P)-dependent dehydrogenase (short-subunit alcohol dehydrogenase family)